MVARTQKEIIDHRQSDMDLDDLEALFSREISVSKRNSHGTLQHVIPKTAVDMFDISKDSEVKIHIYEDGYWVEPTDEEQ